MSQKQFIITLTELSANINENLDYKRNHAAYIQQYREVVLPQWTLFSIEQEDNYCICGQGIMDNRIMINVENGEECVVGNVCINKFGSEEHAVVNAQVRSQLRHRKKGTTPKKRYDYILCECDKIIKRADFNEHIRVVHSSQCRHC